MRINKFILAFLLIASQADAATLLQYTITGSVRTPTTTATGVSGGTLTNGSLSNFANNSLSYSTDPELQVFPASGATSSSSAVSTSSYFYFTITPDSGKTYNLSQLTFKAARGGSSTPRGYVVRSSRDNYLANISTANVTTQRTTWATYTVSLSDASFQSLTEAVTFRIYSYSPATTSTIEFDDITLEGTVESTATVTSDTFVDVPPSLLRYVKIVRSGGTVTAYLYSDSQFTNLIADLVVVAPTTTRRYLYVPAAKNSGVSGSSFSASIENLQLTTNASSSSSTSTGTRISGCGIVGGIMR